MRRRLVLVAAAVAVLGAAMALTRQPLRVLPGPLWERGKMLVAVLPLEEALELVPGAPQALGVYPASRESREFFAEISAGAPRRTIGSGPRGSLGALGRALASAGKRVAVVAAPDAPAAVRDAATSAFGAAQVPFGESELLVISSGSADTITADDNWPTRPAALVLGVPSDGRTPVRVIAAGGEAGLLGGGIPRRPGIATPYDVAATVLAHLGVEQPPGFAGRALEVVRGAGGPGTEGGGRALEDLAVRLERDDSYEQSLTAYTVAAGIGLGGVVPVLLLLSGRRRLALRVAGGGATAAAAYLAAQFVPSPRGDVRALVVLGAFVGGAILSRGRDPVRWTAGVFVAVAAATAVLAIWATLRPAGEPALSFWGNPLESWRFYGLRNFQVAFVAAGAVVGLAALGASSVAIVAAAAGAAFVAGAPAIGANFVGVLTLVFGALLASFAVRLGRFRIAHAAVAALVAGIAFAGALAADSGSVSTHGGRAAERVSEGGVATLAEVVGDRLAVNAEKITAMPGGPFWVALIGGGSLGLLGWALRTRSGANDRGAATGVRAAVGAGAAMTLAVLALEDSGLGAGTITAYAPMAVWVAAVAARNPETAPETPVAPTGASVPGTGRSGG